MASHNVTDQQKRVVEEPSEEPQAVRPRTQSSTSNVAKPTADPMQTALAMV